MRIKTTVLITALLIFIPTLLFAWEGKVVSVTDGDTIKALKDADVACIAVDTEYVDKLTGNDKLAFGYIMYRVFSEILADRLRSLTKELIAIKGKDALKTWKK